MYAQDELAKLYCGGAGLDSGSPKNSPEYRALVDYINSGERGMRVKCPHCESAAVIRSSRSLSKLVKEASCQCNNIVCGHTFVINVEVVRTISPASFPDPLVAATLKQSGRWRGVFGECPISNTEHFEEDQTMT